MATEHARLSRWQNELTPHVVDHLARVNPAALYAEYPRSPTTYDEGFRQVTYRQFANAVNGVAHWLTQTLGPGREFEVLTYIGPNDIRYQAVILGAVKAGYAAFLSSPRNSVMAQMSMLAALKCTKLLSPDPKPPAVAALLQQHSLDHYIVPTVEQLLDEDYPHFPYEKSYPENQSEPMYIIHTSGSTGIPKPLVWTHETVLRNVNMGAQGPPQGFKSLDRLLHGKRVLNSFPPFHGACLMGYFCNAIPFGTVMIGPLAGAIPTADGMAEARRKTHADVAFLVPSIAVELSQDPALLQYFSESIERCVYAGGDLPQAVGDTIASKMPLSCIYGASEIGITPQLLPDGMDSLDWKYVCYHPCIGIELDRVSDGLWEVVLKRSPGTEQYQPSFTMFPDATEYRSRDLFQPHPTIPDFWTWRARADDIIVFLNGEKTNPVSFEQHVIASNPQVSSAIVVGNQRFQACLMLEPREPSKIMTHADQAAFIDKVWPSVEEANRSAPAHARVQRSMILIMDSKKPAMRAGKGTVQRSGTLIQYEAELDQLYKNMDVVPSPQTARQPVLNGTTHRSSNDMHRIVRDAITSSSDLRPQDDTSNLFDLGMDSLAAVGIVRALRRQFLLSGIAPVTIYNNPTIQKLVSAIEALQRCQGPTVTTTTQVNQANTPAGEFTTTSSGDRSRQQSLEAILDEYHSKLMSIPRPPSHASVKPQKHTVVLTGSTGGLGTYILGALLADPNVDCVYCLNRKPESRSFQQNRFRELGIPWPKDEKRVAFFKADFAEPNLALSSGSYQAIQTTITAVIHNAWPMRFDMPLDSFRPQIDGVVNIFRLAASAPQPASVFFVSSLSSVMSYETPSGYTNEKVIYTTDAPFTNGYAESKWVVENLCDDAARGLGISIAFARVGQIAGAARTPGLWSPEEWLPRLVMSSIYLGALPRSLGRIFDKVDWLPIDMLADIIVELALHRDQPTNGMSNGAHGHQLGATVFHLQNPQTTTWKALLPDLESSIESITSKTVKDVPSRKWLEILRQSLDAPNMIAANREELKSLLAQNPALKLLDFYEGVMAEENMVNMLDLQNATRHSEKLRNMEAVSTTWLQKWIREWLAVAPSTTPGAKGR